MRNEKMMLNTWYVYWDQESIDEVPSQIDTAILFAAYFDDAHQVYMPDNMVEMNEKLQAYTGMRFLAFTNDILHEDGSVTNKSEAFLEELLLDQTIWKDVINQMIDETKKFGCEGIELDFENVRKIPDYWQAFVNFVTDLYARTEQEGIKLRVDLESTTPVASLSFPQGPQYMVMCYNLYGNHSEPGPKADFQFLSDIVHRFARLQDIHYAIATGGFDWNIDSGEVTSLTFAQARSLHDEHPDHTQREDTSDAVHFSYSVNGQEHVVYYADEITLVSWAKQIMRINGGVAPIDVWRAETGEGFLDEVNALSNYLEGMEENHE